MRGLGHLAVGERLEREGEIGERDRRRRVQPTETERDRARSAREGGEG